MGDARSGISTGRGRASVANIRSKQSSLPGALSRKKGGSPNAYDMPGVERPKAPQIQGTTNLDVTQGLRKVAESRKKVAAGLVQAPLPAKGMDFSGGTASLNQAISSQNQAIMGAAQALAKQAKAPGGSVNPGPGGPIMKQLVRGFRESGDPAMARFVKDHPDMVKTWLNAESGMTPNRVSAPVSVKGGPAMRNYGLFQFRGIQGRDWLDKYIKGSLGANNFQANPYQQAVMASKYFDLTPGDVRGYVNEINSGNYQGWG